MVSGDAATCTEVVDLLGPEVVTAQVKIGLGRFACRTLTPEQACELIEQRAYEALSARKYPRPYKPESPVTFRVELASVDRAAVFHGRTGVDIVGPRTVEVIGATFWEVWDRFWYR
jgi:D-amino peptidase